MSTSPSATKGTHGGARPGAGRPSLAEHYARPIAETREHCAQRLPETLGTLEALASGTVEQVQERWVAAGTVLTGRGAQARPAFPHLPPEQLVLVSRTVTRPKPDTRANLFLAERVLGRTHSGDDEFVAEQVSAELKQFIEQVQERFSPQAARAIFARLTDPDFSPTTNPTDEQEEEDQHIIQEACSPNTPASPTQPNSQPEPEREIESEPHPDEEQASAQEPSLQEPTPQTSPSPSTPPPSLFVSPISSPQGQLPPLEFSSASAQGGGSSNATPSTASDQDEPYFYEKLSW